MLPQSYNKCKNIKWNLKYLPSVLQLPPCGQNRERNLLVIQNSVGISDILDLLVEPALNMMVGATGVCRIA